MTDEERHELMCLRAQDLERAYPCSPHCEGYLRELSIRNSVVGTLRAVKHALDSYGLSADHNAYEKTESLLVQVRNAIGKLEGG